MDPHQDIVRLESIYPLHLFLPAFQWSRFSGGSGAPFWTLAACGIDPRNFTATQAAIIHSEYPAAHAPDPASLPAMIWSTNYGRLLSQTIFTLFFAGRDFAPRCVIDGKNIQDYLQSHYIEAMGRMADRIRDAGDLVEECVIGWDSMNEPFEGFCGWEDLNTTPTKQGSTLKKGTYPTPAQSLCLGMGKPQTVDHWTFGTFGPARDGTVTIDPKGYKLWADPSTESPDGHNAKWGWTRSPEWKLGLCVWAQHGVWDIESGYILRPDYFRYLPHPHESASSEARDAMPEVEFISDYWKPHWIAFAERIRRAQPEAIIFIQPPVFAPPPEMEPELLKGRSAYSGHYYDGLTLVTRHWNWFNADALGLLRGKYSSTLQAVKIGEGAIRKSLQEQLAMLQADTQSLGPYPTIIGEIGTPFDMDDKRSYGWTDHGKYKGDYSRQERALDASLNGADGGNALNWTVWTYCPDSCHDWGDGWNMEDLSLWSEDDIGGMRRLGLGARRRSWDKKNSAANSMEGAEVYGNESQAVLLRRKGALPAAGGGESDGFSVRAAAAASSLSLATLGMGGGRQVFDDIMDKQKYESDLARWKANPYEFLTDGARAVRAFSRPWPTKVVGRSHDIKFEIGKAYFKLVVKVRPEDKLKVGGVEEEKPATEIYVPLVHFANQHYLDGGRKTQEYPPHSHPHTQTVDTLPSEGHTTTHSSSKGSQLTSKYPSSVDLHAPLAESTTLSTASTNTDTTLSPHMELHRTLQEKDLLDIDVTVSAGRWTVHDQTVKWWYDVPAEGEPDREYTIEIRRAGGVIKTRDVEEAGASWIFNQLCPPEGGCSIM